MDYELWIYKCLLMVTDTIIVDNIINIMMNFGGN